MNNILLRRITFPVLLGLAVASASSTVTGCSGDEFSGNTPGTGGSAGGGAAGAVGSSGATASGGAGDSGHSGSGGEAGMREGGGGAGAGGIGGAGVGGHGAAGKGGGASICAAGEFHCNGDVLQACDATKNAFVDLQACPAGLCDEKKGACDTCHSGDVLSCKDGSTQLVCATDGTHTTPKACGAAAPYCSGKGKCVECTMATQCSAPTQTCYEAQCSSGSCSAVPSSQGTVVPPVDGKPTHDCKKTICNGSGGTTKVADPTNVPVDDGSGCTKPVCNGDAPGYQPLDPGVSCGATAVCNGTGKCGDCVPGATRCEDNGIRTCTPEGTWLGPAVSCVAPSPVCTDGTCRGVLQTASGAKHSCALIDDGSVRCWGANDQGQLGLPLATQQMLQPTPVAGLPKITNIVAGGGHTCALDSGGHVWCWGRNDEGQLGDGNHGLPGSGSAVQSATPVQVKASGTLSHLCAKSSRTCGIDSTGNVVCWGFSFFGETGLGSLMSVDESSLPQIANSTPIAGARELACGNWFTCALGDEGVFCWGDNIHGELGPTNLGQTVADPPQKIAGSYTVQGKTYDYDFTKTTALAAGGGQACAVIPFVAVVCWGAGESGELGDGMTADRPNPDYTSAITVGTPGGDADLRLVLDNSFSCFLAPNIGIQCVGYDADSELGGGNLTPPMHSVTPIEPAGISKATSYMSAGEGTVCANYQGDIRCWGVNGYGQTGIGSAGAFVAAPTSVAW